MTAKNMKPAWSFSLQGEAAGEALSLDVYDVIGDDGWFGGVSAKDVRARLKEFTGKRINVRINSAGGDVFDGTAIYNLLVAHKAKVHVTVDGLAASMASVIAMAGDKIIMPENAMMMVHNPWTITWGDGDQLRQDAEMLDKVRDQLASTYAARSGQSVEKVLEMMAAETWLTGQEAFELGLATEVTAAKQLAAKWNGELMSQFAHVPSGIANANHGDPTSPPAEPTINPPPDGRTETNEGQAHRAKESTMDIKLLAKELKLKDEATERDCVNAAARLVAFSAAMSLIVGDGLSDEDMLGQVKAWKRSHDEDLPAANAKAEELNGKLIDAEVDALVGKKLTPAERDDYVALAKKDRKLFDSMISSRAELGVVGERKTQEEGTVVPPLTGNADAGAELSAAAEAKANKGAA